MVTKEYQREWRKKHLKKVREYHKDYIKKWRKERIKNKECIICGKRVGKTRFKNEISKYCVICLEKESKRNRKGWWKNREVELEKGRRTHYKYKLKALQIISNKVNPICVNCKISEIKVLTINHLEGKKRKEGMNTIYLSVVMGRRKVKDLEVRCHNCNLLYEYERGRFKSPKNVNEITREIKEQFKTR